MVEEGEDGPVECVWEEGRGAWVSRERWPVAGGRESFLMGGCPRPLMSVYRPSVDSTPAIPRSRPTTHAPIDPKQASIPRHDDAGTWAVEQWRANGWCVSIDHLGDESTGPINQ